tara:strand:- start:248 stop:1372 length:1125 start_codon:yes stop_codon:yes gene_type:complete
MNKNNFIPIAQPLLGEEEAKAVYHTIKSGWISMGKKVEEFEGLCCEYLNVKHAIAMNNGTSTLSSLLTALDIKYGDEVVVPNLTYISSANVIEYHSATPILADNDPRTFNISVDNIKNKITDRTKLVMSVDLKGQPVDYDEIIELCDRMGVPLIADSAESFGAIYKSKKVGSQALAHSFSFFANKNLTTGEGGLITTNDNELAKKLKIIRNQGQEGRYNHTHLGNNFRMNDITATIGIEQLKKIDQIINKKKIIADIYNDNFKENKFIETPKVPNYCTQPTWYMYSITVQKKFRDELVNHLKNSNIDTRLSFPPISVQPYYKNKYSFDNSVLTNSIYNFETFLDIPVSILMSEIDQNKIISEINSFTKFMNEKK